MSTKISLPLLNGMCGCISLRTGSIIVAWYTMAMYTFIFVALLIIELSIFENVNLQQLTEEERRIFLSRFTPLFVVLFIRGLLLASSILLLKGVTEGKPKLMLPWIVLKVLALVGDAVSIFLNIFTVDLRQVLLEIMRFGFTVYLFLILYSYYTILNDGDVKIN